MPRQRARGQGTIKRKRVKNKQGRVSRIDFVPRITLKSGKTKDGPRCSTEAEAAKELEKLRLRFGTGEVEAVTVKAYVEAWLERNEFHLKYQSFVAYSGDIGNHVLPYLGDFNMLEVKRRDVQHMIDTAYAQLQKRGYDGAAVIRKSVAAFHRIYEDYLAELEDEDPYTYRPNPVNRKRLKLPPERVDRPTLWTEEEIWRFLYHAATHRIFPALYTAITSGLRQGELLALTWDDLERYLDEEKKRMVGLLRIQHTLHLVPKPDIGRVQCRKDMWHVTGRYFLGTPKTEKSDGFVTIPEDTLKLLDLQRDIIMREKEENAAYEDRNFMFPNTRGAPLNKNYLWATYKALIKGAGVRDVKWHDLRDTFASYYIALTDLITVSSQLRHSTPTTTANRYTHPLIKRRIKATASASELFPMQPSDGKTILDLHQKHRLPKV